MTFVYKYKVTIFLSPGVNIYAQDQFGNTALCLACESGHQHVAIQLLECGADIEKGGRFGTPLIQAARNGHLNVVQSLIDRGAYYS